MTWMRHAGKTWLLTKDSMAKLAVCSESGTSFFYLCVLLSLSQTKILGLPYIFSVLSSLWKSQKKPILFVGPHKPPLARAGGDETQHSE